MPNIIHPYFRRPPKKYIVIDAVLLLTLIGVWALVGEFGFEWIWFALIISLLCLSVFAIYAFKRQKDRDRTL